MSSSPEKLVAFLDLLGFSEAVESDVSGAIQLLNDYSDALFVALNDAAVDGDAVVAPNDAETSRLMELMTVTSFETLLPMSDSLLIVASNVSLFVEQLSHFLLECFRFRLSAFADPEDSGNPIAVSTKTAVLAGSRSRIDARQEVWWPVLFRGGISFGECLPVHLPTIALGARGKCQGFIGKAVVEAVKLEKQTKGPRVLCSTPIQEKVEGNAATYVGPAFNGEQHCFELYWPIAAFEDTKSMSDAMNNHLLEWLQGVANLYAHFRTNDRVRLHYEAYLCLLVASALRKYPDGESELKQALRGLNPDLLQVAFFPRVRG